MGFTSAPPLLTVSTALPNSTASVNFSGGSTATPIDVLAINAVGAVNNSGILTLPATGIGGTFTNSGVVNVAGLTAGAISNAGMINDTAGTLTAVGVAGATSGADITNTGVINEAYTSLTLTAGASTSVNPSNVPGNFSNTGVINFTTAAAAGTNALVVHAQNINMAGSIQATPTGATAAAPLSSTNYLNNIYLEGGYGLGSATSAYTGVVDVSSSIYSNYAQIDAGAARILTGGLYGAGTTNYTTINLGNGQFTDPFTNTTLSYNLSLFPKTTVDAGEVNVYGGQPTGSPNPNINLDGVLSTNTQATGSQYNSVSLANVHNINGSGGFALANNGTLKLAFTGNVNNPNGAAAAGSTAFQYNFVPVTVGSSSTGGTGTVNLVPIDLGNGALSGTSTTAQNVNLLVNGNAILSNAFVGVPTTVEALTTTSPISPAASYVNNHLVVQSTGNIQVGSTAGTFYWPGLVYLSNVTSAASPMTLSSAGSITLGSTAASGGFKTNLNNIIPALVTGGAGVFFETNNLTLNGGTVSTNDNAWVNFASAKIASAFQLTQSASFFGGYTDNVTSTVTELGLQALPTSDYQPAN
ncbi:MAG: hypothetical protein B7Z58_17820 [Acidiphilium sp. 37-64-53]|nr:MAG: hypothetical protein B7Z58_17820 [Acidiphilium sp. 37-64-53]